MYNKLYHSGTTRRAMSSDNHEYIRKEWANGYWRYYYEDVNGNTIATRIPLADTENTDSVETSKQTTSKNTSKKSVRRNKSRGKPSSGSGIISVEELDEMKELVDEYLHDEFTDGVKMAVGAGKEWMDECLSK